MNPCTYVCAHCGSKNIFLEAKAVWSDEKQSWTLAAEEKLQNVFCTDCRPGTKYPSNKKEVELKTEIVEFYVTETINSLAQIKVAPSQLQGLRNLPRSELIEAIGNLLIQPEYEFTLVSSHVETREIVTDAGITFPPNEIPTE
jgi:DNA-directed RNA polymerase subunit RPC12/RpoP